MILLVALPVVGFFLLLSVGFVPTAAQVMERLRSEAMMWNLGMVATCLVGELFVLDWHRTAIYHFLHFDRSVRSDLLIGIVYTLGMGFIFAGFFALGAPQAARYAAKKFFSGSLITFFGHPLAQIFVYLVVVDFLRYWIHRGMHAFHFLWEIHKFHHSATSFTIITGNRLHPLEATFDYIGLACVMAVLGVPLETFLTISLVISFVEKVQHSMVDWRWGWIGRWVFVSPIDHRIHHSPEEEHWDRNYANLFIIWDRIFGSYYKGDRINEEVGVSDNWMNRKGTVYDLTRSMELSTKRLRGSLKTRDWKRKVTYD